MGEAKRRRMAQEKLSASMQVAQRVVAEAQARQASPAEFKVPYGCAAFTLAIDGYDALSIVVDREALLRLMPEYERMPEATWRRFRDGAVEMVKTKDPRLGDGSSGLAVTFGPLAHPVAGPELRAKTRSMLETEGRAHLTWKVSRQNNSVYALGLGFVDVPAEAADMLPKGQTVRVGV